MNTVNIVNQPLHSIPRKGKSNEGKSNEGKGNDSQGYVFSSHGAAKYLIYALVAARRIRTHDPFRPIALYCTQNHLDLLRDWKLETLFQHLELLPQEFCSIIGFKHHTEKFMPFEENLFLDTDMLLLRNPDTLWHQFKPFGYTFTGQESADVFFGGPKHFGIVIDAVIHKRKKTIRNFSLSHLYRAQTGIIYASDPSLTSEVNQLAREFYSRQDETHFISRQNEKGRTFDSCEWSLAMAMSRLKLHVIPWFNGYESPQLDFISGLTNHDSQFETVACKYYCNPFIHSLRGIKTHALRSFYFNLFSIFPRSGDHMWVTPYFLHFGWKHEKHHFDRFVSEQWEQIRREHQLEQNPLAVNPILPPGSTLASGSTLPSGSTAPTHPLHTKAERS